tara:strand:+ start:3363 stop:3641 length:279 start_codon:yes stop_codon:yes gene_type:complete
MINFKSLKKEIYLGYLNQKDEIEALKLEIELLQTAQDSKILTVDDYGNDFVNRCEIHGKEFNLFIQDLKFAGEFLRNKIQEVKKVELPAFIK